MFTPNLKKKDEDKKVLSSYVYESDIEALRLISDKTGISFQNVIRHALNEVIDGWDK